MVTIDPAQARDDRASPARPRLLYLAAWRWHFYAGLYVVPFLVMLAVTGLIMLWVSVLSGRDGEWITVEPQGAAQPVSVQAQAAQAAVGGELRQYIAPRADDLVAVFRIDSGDQSTMVAVDPYTTVVLSTSESRAGLYDLASEIHGTILLGTSGDLLIEIAASLAMVLVATGVYLWWPRRVPLRRVLFPDLTAKGRALWKSLHATLGIWIALVLVVFLVSGLSWAGVWGERFVQAWSTFPAEKWDAVPLSDVTHASMNHDGGHEVPWALEQTPMPASGSEAGVPGMAEGTPITVDTVVAFARTLGFDGRFQLYPPDGEEGVWTISRDSMSNDSSDPTSDRTVHVDQYTGRILADVGYGDYSVYGQAMAIGIALHEGDMGVWNIALNTLFCLSVLFVSISGVVMWWKRRPANARRLVAPPLPREMPFWKGAVLIGLAVSLAFPMAGITLLAILALDQLVISRLPAVRNAVS